MEETKRKSQFESRMEGIAFGVLERIVARRENRQNSREDKNKLIRLTVAVALACAILLSSILASAKWLLLVQFGTDSKLVWKWTPFDVYSNADECKHAILSYQLNVSLGRYFSRPLMCLSDQDRRWGDQQPHWILRASSAPFNTFVAVFPDKIAARFVVRSPVAVETYPELNVGLMLGENAAALVYHSTILNLGHHLRRSRRSNGTCWYRQRLVLVRGHR